MRIELGLDKIVLGLILLLFILASFPSFSFSDDSGNEWTATNGNESQKNGSDATFDKRLPPVLPGEEVNDGNRKMKVWSTAGPVPVAPQPEPWNPKSSNKLESGSVGVIVDRRKSENQSDK